MADADNAPPPPANAGAPAGAGSAPRPAPRALVTLSPAPRRGEPFEVRALVAHPMETGLRVDALGRKVPRDIVRRIEARLEGELVFAADLHQSISANPYLVFPLVAQADGTLTVSWAGDRGFVHSVSVPLKLQ